MILNHRVNKTHFLIALSLVVMTGTSFLSAIGVSVYLGIRYNIDIEGHLKRAADANTLLLAEKEMDHALREIRQRNWTSGYTSVVYRTPDEDVGFWYDNLHESHLELKRALQKRDRTQLEDSNVLMKLRETLLDHTPSGVVVTHPSGISLYPSNAAFAIWFWGSFVCLLISFFIVRLTL